MKREKVLVFDYDGTIVDSFDPYAKRFVQIAGAYGLPALEHFFQSLYEGNFAASLQNHSVSKQDVLKLIEDIRKPFTGKPEVIKPFPGMVALVNRLTTKYSVYIVTSNLTSVIEESLEYWGIKNIKKVYGGDIAFSKVEKFNVIRKLHPRAELVYIADTAGDIHEAKDACYIAVGVTWGYHTKLQLARAHPDILVTKVGELGKLFG